MLCGDGTAQNTVERPDRVTTKESSIDVAKEFDLLLPPMSVQFIRVGVE